MKYALVIGNDHYSDPKLAKLKTPAADTHALANALNNKDIGNFDEVIPIVNQTESETRRAISAFLTSKKPDDLVLVYFSGHGVLDDRGRLFLALKDTETSILKATAISSYFVTDEMDSCRSKRQILILDCCHSGAFARGTKGVQKAVTEVTFEGSGLGRVVLTASDSTQYALEGNQVLAQTNLSLFTHFLLEGLVTGEADANNDGYVSLDEWYDYTYAKVLTTTPKQVPRKWSYHQQGDLIIAKNLNAKKKVVELPIDLVRLLESPYWSAREVAIKELGTLLLSRDNDLADLARSTLEKLRNDDSRTVSAAAGKLLSEVLGKKSTVKIENAGKSEKKKTRGKTVVQSANKQESIKSESVPQSMKIEETKSVTEPSLPLDKTILVIEETSLPLDGKDENPLAEPLEIVEKGNIEESNSFAINNTLHFLPTINFENLNLIKIPSGWYVVFKKSTESREKIISYDYWIGKTPITNKQFYEFARANDIPFVIPENKNNHPVVQISWFEANKFLDWLNTSQPTGLPENYVYALPSIDEWEKAAKGDNGYLYPWGNDFNKDYCNTEESDKSDTTPVEYYSPQGDSFYGVSDMVGNVEQWTRSSVKDSPNLAIIVGSSYYSNQNNILKQPIYKYNPNKKFYTCGFRLVAIPSSVLVKPK